MCLNELTNSVRSFYVLLLTASRRLVIFFSVSEQRRHKDGEV